MGSSQNNPLPRRFEKGAFGPISLIFQKRSAGIGTWVQQPGCRGFIGPVPSASLDKSLVIYLTSRMVAEIQPFVKENGFPRGWGDTLTPPRQIRILPPRSNREKRPMSWNPLGALGRKARLLSQPPSDANGSEQELVEKNFRWNFTVNMIDTVFFLFRRQPHFQQHHRAPVHQQTDR